jgi:hypothetical protein
MGLLKLFSRSKSPGLLSLPSGSFTVDREGRLMTSTLPRSFPTDRLKEIGDCVLEAFRNARQAQIPLTEMVVHYGAFRLLARELRGGAMIFLMPQSPNQPLKSN